MALMHNPPHPGKVLREYLGEVEVSEAAARLKVSRTTLSRVLNGRAEFPRICRRGFPMRWERMRPSGPECRWNMTYGRRG